MVLQQLVQGPLVHQLGLLVLGQVELLGQMELLARPLALQLLGILGQVELLAQSLEIQLLGQVELLA